MAKLKHNFLVAARARLVASRRFQAWRKGVLKESYKISDSSVGEKHFAPAELAKIWGVSTVTIRRIFEREAGVLKLGRTHGRKRRYLTLRIPESVAVRVHAKLAA
jgi:hypothetical protein